MSNPGTVLNKIASEPRLKDLLDQFKKEIFLSFNCHVLATVQEFDPGDSENAPRITATVNYKKTYYNLTENGKYVPQLVDYPIMIDMPVVILGGGTATLTMPIAQGDECMVFFNDRDLDNWFQTGLVGAVATNRLHSFADGIVLVGVRSNRHPLPDYDMERARLQKGNAYVGVGAGANERLVKIANDVTTLNTLLQSLLSQIQTLASACAAITVTTTVPSTPSTPTSGAPNNAATLSAVATAVGTIATQIGGLLE